jgi:hypothetical protein
MSRLGSSMQVRIAGLMMLAGLALATASGIFPLAGEPPLPIVRGDAWRYLKGAAEPTAAWNTAGFNDSAWLTGASGIGYGDNDDATVLSDMRNTYSTVYMRRLFDVPNPAAITGLEMRVDYDDGFIAYLNGVEVARRNVPAGLRAYNTFASGSHEASAGTSGNPTETINLNAFLGALTAGPNVLAVHGFNNTLASSDLTMIVELRPTNAPPAAPSSPFPAPGASGVALNPTLCVNVSDVDSTPLTATFSGREVTGAAADDFTIIALPDTQYYSASFPSTYTTQTQWIVNNRLTRNIVFVTELGDCVDNAATNQQFVNADAAWDLIEANPFAGQPFGLPYGIAVGNHDQTPANDPGTFADEGATTSAFNTWFGVSRYTGRGYYGGHYGINNDNHYELFSASGMDFLALHIEFMSSDSALRQAVLAWADGVLKAYPNRRAMLTTHYLLESGSSTAFGNQGQAIYDALKGNPNLFLMLGGHLDQASRRSDTFNGHTIHSLKSDYQTRPNGGDGWLRIMTFSPANNTIQVQTYSPTLGQFINNHADNTAGTAQNEFTLTYEMAGGTPFVSLGNDSEPSGGTACVPWPGRQPGRQYEWSVAVSDGTSTTTSPRWTFTTALNCTLDSECADGNLCNGVETCSGNTCQAGTPPGCDDADACTTDACNPASGCTHAPVSCDDGDACTNDTCDQISGCGHQAVTCPQGQVCSPATGLCAEPATSCVTTADCGDGNACTIDTCVGANVSALSFDGSNDYVNMGAAPGLGSAQFTVETWFKKTGDGIGNTTSGTNGIASLVPLVAKGAPEEDGSNLDANYIFGLSGNFLAADFEDTASGSNHPITASTTPIVNGTWYHAAATYDGGTWRLYLNGNLEATLAVGAFTPRADSIQPFGLGAMQTSTGTRLGAFQGLLDEVRVWNRALSQPEILAGRDREITSGTGLLGRWGLNENGGPTAGDSVGPTAEVGTLTNGPIWSAADRAPLAAGLCAHAPAPGCIPCNGDEECLDANVCNGVETCSGGACQPGTTLSCDDGDACTVDSCDAEDGCQHAVLSCDDGVACTADACDPGLGCSHLSTCAPGTVCDAGTGQCEAHCGIAADCDDGSACTTDVCNGGNVAALNFAGASDFVTMGAAAGEAALGARAFTLEAWIRRDGASWGATTGTGTGGVTAVPLVTKGRGEAENSNVDANYFFGITATGRPVADFEQFAAGGSGNWAAGQNHPGCSSASIADQNWHHVAVTYSAASGWHFYVDGVEGTSADGSACTTCSPLDSCPQNPGVEPRYDSVQHFGLGTAMTSAGTAGAAGFFGGVMDEVRVWNRALAPAEIAANKDLPLTGGTGLIGRWGFEDGTAGDSTSPAEDGTLVGAPVFSAADKPVLQSGTCGHTPVVCDDANPCTTDSCNPASGCVFTPQTCTDGEACNGLETCNPADGQCVPGTPLNCDDGSVCTLDACSGGACQHVATNEGGACSDGSACTSGDVCHSGLCTGTANASLCDDGNSCSADACAAAPPQGGLAFDGSNDFVDMGVAAELGSAQFTVETWFMKTGDGLGNTTGTNGITSLVPLVTKGAPEAEGSSVDANYILGLSGNFLAADFEDTATGGNHPITAATTPIVTGTWYHAAATYDGTTWRLYLNGNLEATLAVGAFTPRADSIQHAALGAMVTSTGTRLGAFQGVLDEARIWNRARGQAEIQATMTRRLTAMPGLTGRWGLDEGTGPTAFDSTVPASNGTLTNITLPGAWVAGNPALADVLCASGNLPDGTTCADDGNACTANTCTVGVCGATYAPTPGCCAQDVQCDDGNNTTVDTCVAASCNNAAPVSCSASAQCDDANPCSLDVCAGGNISALNFNGTSDFVTMGAAAGETALGARAFTLEGWIRRDGASWGATTNTGTGGVTGVPLVTKGRGEAENSNVDANYFLGITTAGRPVADFEQFAAGGGWVAGQNHPACASGSIADQAWHHVAVTYSTTTGWHFYIDGVEGTTADATACTTCSPAGSCPQSPGVEPRYDSVQHFGLGTAMTSAGTSGAAGFFGGVMDEVRVWNRALTAVEIQAGRTQEIATATNLIGRWSLNENGGTTATDTTVTPTQNNGTFAGAPAWSAADRAPIVAGTCTHTAGNSGALCRAAGGVCDVAEACTGASVFCPSDLKAPNGTSCSDGNTCTANDACQAGTCTGAAIPAPSEVANVTFDAAAGKLTWNALGGALPVQYDVTRGLTTQPPEGGAPGSVCLATGTSLTEVTDATVPGTGEAYWYLVRGRHSCGTGTWGYKAANGVPGLERLVNACP